MALMKKVRKIGNSYGIILPTEIMEVAGISKDAELEISVKENQIILKPASLKDHKVMKTFLKVLEDYNETFKKLAK
jgi:antitoxin component of MazEF toxin-antitoxin module